MHHRPPRLIFFDCFSNGRISGALAELIRSTRAPTKDRFERQDHERESGVSRHARAGPHASPSWCPRARARVTGGSVSVTGLMSLVGQPCQLPVFLALAGSELTGWSIRKKSGTGP